MSEKGKSAETMSNVPTFSGREDWEDFERAVMLEAARKDLKGVFENLRGHDATKNSRGRLVVGRRDCCTMCSCAG